MKMPPTNQVQETDFFPSIKDLDAQPTEVIIAIVGALGTDHNKIRHLISDRMQAYNYDAKHIRVSTDIICRLANVQTDSMSKYDRAQCLIEKGNELRDQAGTEVLATAAAAQISELRGKQKLETRRLAFIISSLKHQDEVAELRRIYGRGFFLFAIHRSKEKRFEHLMQNGGMTESQASRLIARDENEAFDHGQKVRNTFHLADFFLYDEGIEDKLKYAIERCLDLVFGKPSITPTFNEFAMYMAFASSLRSADLSRQVGAVIAKDKQILATGANDCPTYGGGLYWPGFTSSLRIEDVAEGRDVARKRPDGKVGFDSNSAEKARIIDQILKDLNLSSDANAREKLEKGPIADITEYGRVVHAEMEAILSCARSSISCLNATIYCTTFPCHNCAKHIIAAGIRDVVFVEPYPKSLALDFHPDCAVLESKQDGKVRFKPFVGVGPKRFFDLFSLSWGEGRTQKRKDKKGNAIVWDSREALPRLRMAPESYLKLEEIASQVVRDATEENSKVEEGILNERDQGI